MGEVRQVFPEFFELLAIGIGIAELGRALNGWKSPNERTGLNFLNDEYYPGDINFDPPASSPRTRPSSRRWPPRRSRTAASPCSRSPASSRRSSWTASPSSSTTSASKASMHFHHPCIDRELEQAG